MHLTRFFTLVFGSGLTQGKASARPRNHQLRVPRGVVCNGRAQEARADGQVECLLHPLSHTHKHTHSLARVLGMVENKRTGLGGQRLVCNDAVLGVFDELKTQVDRRDCGSFDSNRRAHSLTQHACIVPFTQPV